MQVGKEKWKKLKWKSQLYRHEREGAHKMNNAGIRGSCEQAVVFLTYMPPL